jgi:aryl-alcohol dehydrogenase-like predicted oxidoreductase
MGGVAKFMRYNQLGKSGIKVSEISFGGIPILRGKMDTLTRLYDLNIEDAKRVLNYAFDAGINFFDTAVTPEYCDSEEKIGHAFKGMREDVIISSKAHAYTYEEMKKATDKSFKNLKTDYIDIYMIHQIKPSNLGASIDYDVGAIRCLLELKEKDRIGTIGASSHYVSVFEKLLKFDDVGVFQLPMNVIEHGIADNIVIKAKEKGIGAIGMKIMGGGVLSDYFPVGQLTLFCLNYGIDAALVGMGNVSQIDENIDSLNKKVDTELIDKIRKELFPSGYCDRCQLCICPIGIDISKYLRYRAYYFVYGLRDWAKKRYLMKGKKIEIEYCDDCRICEKQCPQNIPIVDMLKDLESIS